MSFQLATLEERGVVMVWTILKLKRGNLAGSETDLGLGIGGRVKLVRNFFSLILFFFYTIYSLGLFIIDTFDRHF